LPFFMDLTCNSYGRGSGAAVHPRRPVVRWIPGLIRDLRMDPGIDPTASLRVGECRPLRRRALA
jgi:hypothetical protein